MDLTKTDYLIYNDIPRPSLFFNFALMNNLNNPYHESRPALHRRSPEDIIGDIKNFLCSMDGKGNIEVQDGQISLTVTDPSQTTTLRSLLTEADQSSVIGFRSSSGSNGFKYIIGFSRLRAR